MTAELYGMFFVAEDVFGAENNGRPLELTCYRRNLWQCSGQVTLPRHITHAVDEQGRQIPVFELAASIAAIESIEGKTTEIISIPWKSAHPIGAEEPKSSGGPPNIVLDLANGQEVDANRVSLPLSWKRLQFKHATANNGRRKGLQQHYLVQISLLGKQQSGEYIKIAEISSGPVIVRGRSPRNFDSRKDIPLTGDKKLERRSNSDASASAPPHKDNGMATPVPKYQPPNNLQVRRAASTCGFKMLTGHSNLQNGARLNCTEKQATASLPQRSWRCRRRQGCLGHRSQRGLQSPRDKRQGLQCQAHGLVSRAPSTCRCRKTRGAQTGPTRIFRARSLQSPLRLPCTTQVRVPRKRMICCTNTFHSAWTTGESIVNPSHTGTKKQQDAACGGHLPTSRCSPHNRAARDQGAAITQQEQTHVHSRIVMMILDRMYLPAILVFIPLGMYSPHRDLFEMI